MSENIERLSLKVTEAAAMTGYSRGMAYQLVARGEWPSIRIGKSIRVPVAALREWVERKTAEANKDRDQ